MRRCHPGEIIREDIMPALGMTVTDLAKHLGVARPSLANLIHEHTGISMDMASRLGQAFGQSTRFWATLQFEHDLWKAEQGSQPKVKRIAHAPAKVRGPEAAL
jgi:antitoxin HigA-1